MGNSSFEGERFAVVQARQAAAQSQLLIRTGARAGLAPDGWLSQPAAFEDIVLAYLRDPSQSALPGPELAVTASGEPR